MNQQMEKIKTTFERVVQAMTAQPTIAKGTISTKVTLRDGLACDVETGPWKLVADMSAKIGGTETAPTPGHYMSTALGSCQAICIAMWAACYGVPIDKLNVIVEVGKDSRGLFGVDDNPPRWEKVKYRVNIQSPAPEAEINKVLDAAHAHSPMRGNLEHAFAIEREVNITTPVS